MIEEYADKILRGELVGFPTETVYGLGADASNLDAIRRLYELKGRPVDNPLIVHISSLGQLQSLTPDYPLSGTAEKLAREFWSGPLTMILPKKPEVLDAVTAGLPTVAVRMPNCREALELIDLTGPLVAPSANLSGKPSPTRVEHVREDFGEDFPVIDGGQTMIGLESTVLDLTTKPLRIYRPGFISKEEIEEVAGEEVEYYRQQVQESSPSPGLKYTHYAPRAEVMYWDGDDFQADALYLLTQTKTEAPNVVCFDDEKELARELYDQFRQADRSGYKKVIIEKAAKDYPALTNRIEKAIGR